MDPPPGCALSLSSSFKTKYSLCPMMIIVLNEVTLVDIRPNPMCSRQNFLSSSSSDSSLTGQFVYVGASLSPL